MRWEYEDTFFVLKGLSGFDVRVSTRMTPAQKIPDYLGLKQVHSADILIIKSRMDIPDKTVEGDGIITSMEGLRIGVRTADCYPVFLIDKSRRIAGVLHAGWRGSYKGIVSKGVSFLIEEFGSYAGDITVAFGPGICGKCYEVGPEMKDYFPGEFFYIKDSRLTLDIFAYNVYLLRKMGIENIIHPPACTFEDDRLYSYRRNRDRSRLISTVEII